MSAATLKLLAQAGFTWAASGENVLANSLAKAQHAPHTLKEAWLYRPYSIADTGLTCFFRDDGLSDLIGFTYATWHADDAVADLVHHLEKIAARCHDHPDRVVSIIMDGENAWEHYPENAYYFLGALYRRLGEAPAASAHDLSRTTSNIFRPSACRCPGCRELGVRIVLDLDRRP